MLTNRNVFLVVFFIFVNAGCYKKTPGSKSAGKEQLEIKTPIERQIKLENTTIGISTILSDLNVPWEITWGPDNWIWFTEQSGTVSKVNPATGEKKLLLTIPNVYRDRTLGLLCIAVHPNLKKYPFVFLNYTYKQGEKLMSRWVRYTYSDETLIKPLVLLELPADKGHNGARIAIALDGKLMLATGDADIKNDDKNSGNAQNDAILSGKILRLNIDGTIPKDNPVVGSPVWAKGFRVPQGLVYASNGNLYSAEHGNINDDEVNLIKRGGNYGYPNVAGKCNLPHELEYCAKHTITAPIMAWTPTIAPAGIDYYSSTSIPEWQNAILLTTLKETDFRVLKLNDAGDAVTSEHIYLDKEFGRLRDICVSPAGDIYISTSNRDWNPAAGFPKEKDDKIIRLFKKTNSDVYAGNFKETPNQVSKADELVVNSGAKIYNQYCASCHKADGSGLAGTFPPLKGAEQVSGSKNVLINIVLNGLSGPIKVKGKEYNQQMPAFNILSDKDLAEVLSYVRSEFGNINHPITPTEIAQARAASKR